LFKESILFCTKDEKHENLKTSCIYISHMFLNLKGMLERKRNEPTRRLVVGFHRVFRHVEERRTPLSKNNIVTRRRVNPAFLIGRTHRDVTDDSQANQ